MEVQKLKKKKEKALNEGELKNLFFACKGLAEIYFREEKYDDALREYKEMERASDASGNKMDVARANRMIGEVYSEKGDFDQAIRHQLIHLKISREHFDRVEIQRALATLGRTYFLQADSLVDIDPKKRSEALQEAKNYYLQSFAICEELNESEVGAKQRMEMRARLFLNIGLVLDGQQDSDEAINKMQKAVLICKSLDLWEDLYRIYAALGSIYQRIDDKAKAIDIYDKALEVASRLENKNQLLCEILPLKAEVLLEFPNFRGARQALLKAHKLKSPSPIARQEIERKLRIVAALCQCEEKLISLPPDELFERKRLYESIGDMSVELKNFRLALCYYHLMLECVQKSGDTGKALIDSYVSLAETYKDNKQYEEALEYFKRELIMESDNSAEACKTTLNIAVVLQLMGKPDEMLEAYEEAKNLAEQTSNVKLKARVHNNMYRALVECNRLDLAEAMNINQANTDSQDWSNDSSSENEDNEEEFKFGADICLEEISDIEDVDGVEDIESKQHRTRVKSRSCIQKKNNKGETPLHLAAIDGKVTLVEKLIDQGHSVNVKDFGGWTPLHEACNHGHKEIVEILIKHGANINDRGPDGITPLLDAACNGCLEIMEILIENGASALMQTNSGESVIDCLKDWRKRYVESEGRDIDGDTLRYYNFIFKKLENLLEKVGRKSNSKGKQLEVKERRKKKLVELPESEDFLVDLRRSLDEKECSPPLISRRQLDVTSAAAEYESAIKSLRTKNRIEKVSGHLRITKNGSSLGKSAIPALLPEEENVGDDWLDDDVTFRPKKKRKIDQFVGQPLRRPSSHSRIPGSVLFESSESSQDSDVEVVKHSRLSEEKADEDLSDLPSTSGSLSNRLKVMNTARRKQISLMATGVSREKIKKPQIEETVQEKSPSIEPITSQSGQTLGSPMNSVRVRVEGKLLLVPVPGNPDSLTVGWLAKEAAKRYNSLEGVEPELRLKMEDGAILTDLDPVSLLFNSTEVVGTVLSWKHVPLIDRYKQACDTAKTRVNNCLKDRLEASQASGILDLTDLSLRMPALTPLFKALMYHYPLKVLKLGGNIIGNEGVKILGESLVKLPNLQVLDLHCTNITDEGLIELAHTVAEARALQQLRTLKLGYNNLSNCLQPLSILLSTIPALSHLSLPHCKMTAQTFRSSHQLSLNCLQKLDLKFNKLGSEGLREVLGRLDAHCIEVLDLSGVGGGSVLREVGLFLENYCPSALISLDLSYCHPEPQDIKGLEKSLRCAPNLKNLGLEGTSAEDSSSKLTLLELPLEKLNLGGTVVSEELQLPQQMSSLVISSRVPQPWGFSGPHCLYTTAL